MSWKLDVLLGNARSMFSSDKTKTLKRELKEILVIGEKNVPQQLLLRTTIVGKMLIKEGGTFVSLLFCLCNCSAKIQGIQHVGIQGEK